MKLTAQENIWQKDTLLLNADAVESASATLEMELDQLLLPGQVLDIYQCQKLLGRGGMGVVYLARNTSLQRLCALKLLSPAQLLQAGAAGW